MSSLVFVHYVEGQEVVGTHNHYYKMYNQMERKLTEEPVSNINVNA
jgi:hypothetical protein